MDVYFDNDVSDSYTVNSKRKLVYYLFMKVNVEPFCLHQSILFAILGYYFVGHRAGNLK